MIETVINLGTSIINASIAIWEWCSTEFTLLGNTYTVIELLFGSGIVIILGIIIAKWIT